MSRTIGSCHGAGYCPRIRDIAGQPGEPGVLDLERREVSREGPHGMAPLQGLGDHETPGLTGGPEDYEIHSPYALSPREWA